MELRSWTLATIMVRLIHWCLSTPSQYGEMNEDIYPIPTLESYPSSFLHTVVGSAEACWTIRTQDSSQCQ